MPEDVGEGDVSEVQDYIKWRLANTMVEKLVDSGEFDPSSCAECAFWQDAAAVENCLPLPPGVSSA